VLQDTAGRRRQTFQVGEAAEIVCQLAAAAAVSAPTVGLLIRDRLGNDVFGTNTFHLGVDTGTLVAGERLDVTFRIRLALGPGSYSLAVAAHAGRVHHEGNFDWWDRALVFEIVPDAGLHFIGTAQLPVEVTVRRGAAP
jgi:lipopolysaccharide transport system ATP-binding protein